MALYNDRGFNHETMMRLDPELDIDPNNINVGQMVRADTLNRLAFVELEYYQKHRTFKGVHPIVSRYRLYNELNRLRHSDPDQFMKDLVNTNKSITRYESLIRTGKHRDTEERVQWESLIQQFQNKLEIMKELISS